MKTVLTLHFIFHNLGFIPCNDASKWPDCWPSNQLKFIQNPSPYAQENQNVTGRISQSLENLSSPRRRQSVTIKFTPLRPGHLFCNAYNKIGNTTGFGSMMIVDMDQPFKIFGSPDNITVGDMVTFECAAFIYNYSNKIIWTKDGKDIESNGEIQIKNSSLKFSHRKSIEWKNITKDFSGVYQCKVFERNNSFKQAGKKSFILSVHDPEAPKIISNFDQAYFRKSVSDQIKVKCNAKGRPSPTLVWYKNNDVFKVKNNNRQDILISPDNSSITFSYLKVEDSGRYRCRAENRRGFYENKFELSVEGNQNCE